MLIFDSGIGGLSILNSIKKILPKINYIYVLDNQAFPYGKKKEFFIIERSVKIINTIKKNYPITIVLIACNTASTIGLSILKKTFNFPVIGIFPEIKTAEKITKNKIIGLIATKATINSFYIKNKIYKISSENTIKIIATNRLAEIAENKIKKILTSNIELKKIFQPWTTLLVPPDTIILGCTHFLLLKKEIKKILYQATYFIDSRKTIKYIIKKHFEKKCLKQHIKKNTLLYSEKQGELKKLLSFLKKYEFSEIKSINLN